MTSQDFIRATLDRTAGEYVTLPRSVVEELLTPPAAPAAVAPEAPDELDQLTVAEAAALLKVPKRWIYDRAARLPFVSRLAPRTLRISKRGLERYLRRRAQG